MHWRTDSDSVFRSEASGQAQHFGAIALHVEIAGRARIWCWKNSISTPERRELGAREHRMVKSGIRPTPKPAIDFVMHFQEMPRHNRQLADPAGQGPSLHSILDAKHTLLV